MRFKFPRSKRLRHQNDIKKIYSQSRKIDGISVRLYMGKAASPGRVAVVATKKIGSAVIRNFCKRRLKEIIRKNQHKICLNYDLIMVVKSPVNTLKFEKLENEIVYLVSKNLKNETD